MKGPELLKVQGLTRAFGGVVALEDVEMRIGEDEILGLIGPNGAGKTTLFNVISGVLKPDRGAIFFRDREITGLMAHQITAAGIARTFQNVRLFPEMTVLENVLVGRHTRTSSGLAAALLKMPSERREEGRTRQYCLDLLESLGMSERAEEPSKNLPFGMMRLLEIARALASEPRLLLLDEPAAGLNHAETDRLSETIMKIRDRGVAIIVVEHDMRLVMDISDRVVVLNQGKKLAEGAPREIQNNPEVIAAYLGETIHPPRAASGRTPAEKPAGVGGEGA